MNDPVRIRYYGIRLTRRRYLTLQGLLLGLLLMVFLWIGFFAEIPPPEKRVTPFIRLLSWWLENLVWIVLIVLALNAVEAFFVLRRFAREEAAQRARAAATPAKAPPSQAITTPPKP